MLRSILATMFGRTARQPVHDENVHRLKNAEANVLASVELAARASVKMGRKLGNPEHIEDKIKEANELASSLRQIIDSHPHDYDDGLLSGMDKRIERGDRK